MGKITITTEEVKKSAAFLSDKATTFDAEVEKIYAEIADIKISFQGQASDTFNKKIEEYRTELKALKQNVDSYVELLNKEAGNIESTDTALAESASKL